MNRIASGTTLAFVLIFMLTLGFDVQPGEASGTIYIRADGSVDPLTAPISTVDNVTYTLIGNIPSDTDGIVVEKSNIAIDGAGYTIQGVEAQYSKGISLSGITNVTVRNTNIKNFDYGFYLYSSSNNTMSGNNITNNDRGIWLDFSSNNTVSGNNITANNDQSIWLYDSSNNNTVYGNHITNNYGGIKLDFSSNNTISGNNITNNHRFGFYLYSSSNNTVSGNMFVDDGLRLRYSYGNVVEDNTVNGKPLVYLEGVQNYRVDDAGQVILVNCNNITVENLNLSNTDTGVQLSDADNCSIAGNNITDNDDGIRLYYSSNNTISGNNITANNYYDGIRLYYSSNNTISGNNITNNRHVGIALLYSSSDNTISGNNITNNYDFGIGIHDSSNNNTVYGNNIANNDCGILLYDSSNNIVYHNNFVDNTVQAQVTGGYVNAWDNGYEGNYWSDYTGADGDGDGIGDSSYIIDENNMDYYPLMNPYWNPADINKDLEIDIYDVVLICNAYDSTPSDINWNCHCDIDGDGDIDIYDIVTMCNHYGESWQP